MLLLSASIVHPHEGAIPTAVSWVQSTLLGSAATSVAILAVAILGIGMLGGHFELRGAARAVLGAFILFGAPLLAYQMIASVRGGEAAAADIVQQSAPLPPAPPIPKNAPVQDPYAGAAVPQLQP
jgi:type IV secretory pathway VirB2 component (pilin)